MAFFFPLYFALADLQRRICLEGMRTIVFHENKGDSKPSNINHHQINDRLNQINNKINFIE